MLINKQWSKLNRQQLGEFGEYLAKMSFTSYGWYVYTTEVDDHGIDFVVKTPDDKEYFDVQVKSVRQNTLNIKEHKMALDDRHIVCYLRFVDGEIPEMYIIRTDEWNKPENAQILYYNDYKNGKSIPDYILAYSKRNKDKFEKFKAEKFFEPFQV